MPSHTQLTLVAHRGYPGKYPENTMVGFRAAVAAGAQWLETDVQCSADGVPMLYHDAELLRTSGTEGMIWDFDAESLMQVGASHGDQFGEAFRGEPIPTLAQLVDWLADASSVELLVEIKGESIRQFGSDSVVSAVLRDIERLRSRCTIISKHYECLSQLRIDQPNVSIGWVLPAWNEQVHRQSKSLGPDWLICNHTRLPEAEALWTGTWRWMAYTVNDPHLARSIARRGIPFIETNEIESMLKSTEHSAMGRRDVGR